MKLTGVLPILLIPLLTAPVAWVLSFFSGSLSRLAAWAALITALFLDLTCWNDLADVGSLRESLGGWAPPWGLEAVATPWTVLLGALLLFGALCLLVYSGSSVGNGRKGSKDLFSALLLWLTASLLGVLFLRDLCCLYLFLEFSLLSGAGLLVFSGERARSEGFGFLFWGSVSFSILLVGFVGLFAVTGTAHLDDLLAQLFASKASIPALAAGSLVMAGFVFPFIFASPFFFPRSGMDLSPFILGFLSGFWVRSLAFLFFVLVFFTIGFPGLEVPLVLRALEYAVILFLLFGFFQAARQKDLRAALCSLSVAQLAFPLLGMVVGNKSALTGSLIEIMNGALATAGLFFLSGALKPRPGSQPLSVLAGLGRQRPVTGLYLVVLAASLTGIPPTAGFFGRFYLIQGALEQGDWVSLSILGFSSLFILAVFFRLILLLYGHRERLLPVGIPTRLDQGPVLVLALMVILFGIFHQELLQSAIEPSLPKAFLNVPVPNVPFLGKEVE